MEEDQQPQESSQQFENIDFNTTPPNDHDSINIDDQEEVNTNVLMTSLIRLIDINFY